MELIREFFGYGGYRRLPEGYLSPEHLIFVTSLLLVMLTLALMLGRRNRSASQERKNRVLLGAAILIDGLEIIKITAKCMEHGPEEIVYLLPLFLCSVQLIAIPLAALSKGRLREAALDFIVIFGPVGALLGTYAAGQNYGCYPVFSADNVISGLTHGISGFAAVYILVSGMASMKRSNVPITYAIILSFCIPAFVMNKLVDYNYMFLMRGDGTPYDLLYNLVDGHVVLYPLGVVGLFFLYITMYYQLFYVVSRALSRRRCRVKA
ncbi:MAG: YwaF family protein [Clostridia bacterium]|nr:YwaF family protein [Clostridia bacterium]